MKRVIILFFAVVAALPAYCQTHLQDGDDCFEGGDYTCAVSRYSEALKLASGRDKQLIEIKLTRAKNCTDWIRIANQAFGSRDYRKAKENYQKISDSNPKDTYAKAQLEKCNNYLNPPPTTLSVSKETLSFSSSGGNESITVTTNALSYSINALPSWCTVQKYASYFIITCKANMGTITRNGNLTVLAGDKAIRINITQATKTKTSTSLSASRQNVSFETGGGRTIIDINTNGDYQISLLPSWCKVGAKHSSWFSLVCDANNSRQSRSSSFKVSSGGKEIRIQLYQSGTSQTNTNTQGRSQSNTYSSQTNTQAKSQSNSYSPYKQKKCFNCPKAKYPWGLSLGYVSKEVEDSFVNERYYSETMDGIQFGVRYEPLFKYGLGLNTGLFYEYYFLSDDYYNYYNGECYDYEYQEHVLSIPLHLEYRFNFSRYFNVFVYGGIGLDMITNRDFDDFVFQSSLDYGGGVRIDHVQINIGQSMRLNKLNDIQNIGNQKKYKNLIVSLSYMF